MEIIEFLSPTNVVSFMLVFFRFAGLFIMTPFFSHQSIPMTVKTAFAFVLTVVAFTSVPPLTMEINVTNIILAILSEFFLGFTVGLMLQLVMNIMTFAGVQISFIMGFSMASVMDPQTGISMPIISNVLALLALMVFLALDGHHVVILFINDSLSHIPLGGFVASEEIFNYMVKATSNMFIVGFMIAFPIIALSLLADVIFGMLMKTMPQFNLLVIGFPIKIMVAFVVILAVLVTMLNRFQLQMYEAFKYLPILYQ